MYVHSCNIGIGKNETGDKTLKKHAYHNIILFTTTLLLCFSISGVHSTTASAEEIQTTQEPVESTSENPRNTVQNDVPEDNDGVLFDRDVIPDDYDRSVYTTALSTIYLEENSYGDAQELSLYLDRDNQSEAISIRSDEESGILTVIFPNTMNAIGNLNQNITNSYVRNISVTNTTQDITVVIKYRSDCVITTSKDKRGVSVTFAPADYSLRIRMPEGITESQIKDTDYYYNHEFVLQIPGQWKSYYDQYPVMSNNNVISSIKISQSGNKTLIRIRTSRLQGYKYTQQGNYLFVTIDNPRKIYKNIVVLDAGHGGKDFGARSRGTKEKNINYKIIYTLAREYFNSPNSQVKAYWSRYNDQFISLSARARFASEVQADLFVSLHMNSASNKKANGMEVYYARSNNGTSSMGISSRTLAQRMHDQLENNLSIPSRGVKKAEFYVLRHNTVPAILIELGFISGNRDYAKITSSNYQKNAAQNIYDCISNVFKVYPTGR